MNQVAVRDAVALWGRTHAGIMFSHLEQHVAGRGSGREQ